MTHLRHLLVLLATVCGLAMLGAAPAAADVDCADLPSQGAAQSYFDGRSGDLDRLDADADGRACEANDPVDHGGWTLPGLAVLLLGALVLNGVVARRQGSKSEARISSTLGSPSSTHLVQQRTGIAPESAARTPQISAAADDSLVGLSQALRRVPRTKRMPLVELYAVAHHAVVQDVLSAIADEASDLELQRWARSAHDSPSRRH